jgi:hypothetical protein
MTDTDRLIRAHQIHWHDDPALGHRGLVQWAGAIIIPAATAKRLAQNLNGMLATAVVVAVACFLLSLLRRQP